MYRIWIDVYKNGVFTGSSISAQVYTRKGNATRRAKQLFDTSRTNEVQYVWKIVEV